MQEGKKVWKRDQFTDAPTPRALDKVLKEDEKKKGADIFHNSRVPIKVFNLLDLKDTPRATAEPIQFTAKQNNEIMEKNQNVKKCKKQITKNCSKYQIKSGKSLFSREEKTMKATNADGDGFRIKSKVYKCLNSPDSFDKSDFESGDFSREATISHNDQSSSIIKQEINNQFIPENETKDQSKEATETSKQAKFSILEQEHHSLDSAMMKQRKEEIDIILGFQSADKVYNEYSSEHLSKLIEQEQALLEEHKKNISQEENLKTGMENKIEDPTGNKNVKFLIFGGVDPYQVQSSSAQKKENGISIGRNVLNYNFRQNTWTNIATMPFAKHHHSAVVCNGLIYIIGGTKIVNDIQKPVLSKSMWSFNPKSLEWKNESNMPYARRDFAVVSIDYQKGFYVIGGEDSDKKALSSTIFYDVKTKNWEEKTPLKIARTGLMAIGFNIKNNKIFNPILDKCNDITGKSKNFDSISRKKIWAAGGIIHLTNAAVTNIIEEYDIYLDKWTKVGQLRIPRCFGKMCLVNNDIYVVGGLTNTNGWKTSLNSVDKYIEESNSWQLTGKMKFSRHGHDLLYSNSKIFIVGGVSTIGPTSFYSVECFDTRTKKFLSGFAALPEPLSGLAAIRFDC